MTTYGPFDNPKYVVTVMVEHGGYGGKQQVQLLVKYMINCKN